MIHFLNITVEHGFQCINVCQRPREMLKTEAVGRGFQHIPRDLANGLGLQNLPRDLANVNALENNVSSLSLHKFNEILLKFGKYMALYFVTVWQSTSECTFFTAIIRFDLDVSKMTGQGGCCTTVVVRNEVQIYQQKRRKAYLYM